jgi:P4 family phage/plasmid primase-like protien
MMKSPVESITVRLGGGVMILALAPKQKKPIVSGWEKLRLPSMADPAYRATLNHGCNLGVSLGAVSGGLCALDFDTDEDADAFLAVNPALQEAFRTRGARGCQVWVRIRGEFPDSCNVKDASGRKVCEWRATGRQSVVWGIHPSGKAYEWMVDAPPVEIAFDEIRWPVGWVLPWEPEPEEAGEAADRQLIEEHGAPFTRSEKGKLTLNSMYFVARFARSGDVLFEPGENCFYGYQAERGLWRRQTAAALKIELAEGLKEYADAQAPADGAQIINARNERFLAGLANLLQGHVEETDAFEREHGVVHVSNGMLHLDADPVWLRPFDAGYRSRNAAPVAYDPTADCPRFRSELLESALEPDDVSLVQRYAGACLLGRNLAQKILVLIGTAGGGKSTWLEILERMLGTENVSELRTEHLAERFESARFIGKQLLTGKDVRGRFLEEEGAHKLKALVGHDLLDTECKGSRADFKVRGDFSVVITCNSRLRVKLDGDADAWRRRLLIVKYERPKPEQPERDFALHLLAEEGPGILRWMVEGARAHLAELKECGDYRLSDRQGQRVNALLAESDSVREFIRQRVEACSGADVAVYELVEAYAAFCDAMGWEPLSSRRVENALADAMQELRRAARRNGIMRGGSAKRGFENVRLIPAPIAEEAAEV